MATDNDPAKSTEVARREAPLSLTANPAGPTFTRIKRPSIALLEDEYTSSISKIIKRDFFTSPSTSSANPSDSSDVNFTKAIDGRVVPVDTGLSLTEFHARYTSEDNESFDKLLDRQNETNAKKNSWAWTDVAGAAVTATRHYHRHRLASEGQARHIATERKRMLEIAPSALQNVDDEYRKQDALITALIAPPKPQSDSAGGPGSSHDAAAASTVIPQSALIRRAHHPDLRPVAPNVRLDPPRNNLLFMPDSIEDQCETIMQAAERKSRAGPKKIIHQNTRLPPDFDPEQPIKSGGCSEETMSMHTYRTGSPTLADIRSAIRAGNKAGAVDIAARNKRGATKPSNKLGMAAYDSDTSDTETRTPPPPPYGRFTVVQRSNRASSPEHSSKQAQHAPSSTTTTTPFALPKTSKRELLHHRIVDSTARQKAKARNTQFTPLPAGGTSAFIPASVRSRLGVSSSLSGALTPKSNMTSLTAASTSSSLGLSSAGERLLAGLLLNPKVSKKTTAPAPAAKQSTSTTLSKRPEKTTSPEPTETERPPPSSTAETPQPEHQPPPDASMRQPSGVVHGIRSGPRFENLPPSQLFHATTNYRYSAMRNGRWDGASAQTSSNKAAAATQLPQSSSSSSQPTTAAAPKGPGNRDAPAVESTSRTATSTTRKTSLEVVQDRYKSGAYFYTIPAPPRQCATRTSSSRHAGQGRRRGHSGGMRNRRSYRSRV